MRFIQYCTICWFQRYYHRIIESYESEGPIQGNLSQIPERLTAGSGCSVFWLVWQLSVPRDKVSTTSLSNLFSASTILIAFFFLISTLNLHSFFFETISSCPVTTDFAKESVPLLLIADFIYWKAIRSPQNLLQAE